LTSYAKLNIFVLRLRCWSSRTSNWTNLVLSGWLVMWCYLLHLISLLTNKDLNLKLCTVQSACGRSYWPSVLNLNKIVRHVLMESTSCAEDPVMTAHWASMMPWRQASALVCEGRTHTHPRGKEPSDEVILHLYYSGCDDDHEYLQCCPQEKSLSLRTNLQVLVLGPQLLVFVFVLFLFYIKVLVFGLQSPWKLSRTLHFASSLVCMIMWSINLVLAILPEVTVKNGLLTDVGCYLL